MKNQPGKTRLMRRAVQLACLVIANGYWHGFQRVMIYGGGTKRLCVPFLNCYSCPGAYFACPLGSLQSILAASRTVSLYVAGLIIAGGAAVGRLFCGWLCPFGLLQEALSMPRSRRVRLPRWLTSLKYVILLLTLLLPILWLGRAGLGEPYFCKFLCPAGTLEGGVLLVLGRPELRVLVGWLFFWKVAVLAFFLALMPFVFRVFCRTACPLGAFYGLFNAISLWRLERDYTKCTGCGTCREVCPVGVKADENPNHPECFRCLECSKACPAGALRFGVGAARPEVPQRTSFRSQ